MGGGGGRPEGGGTFFWFEKYSAVAQPEAEWEEKRVLEGWKKCRSLVVEEVAVAVEAAAVVGAAFSHTRIPLENDQTFDIAFRTARVELWRFRASV